MQISAPPVLISDTIREGVFYKRVRFAHQIGNNRVLPVIGYFRCDKKGTMFQLFKTTSEQIGCPMIRYESLPTKESPSAYASEVLFVTNKLTSNELKVFAAWEKNAKENPVK